MSTFATLVRVTLLVGAIAAMVTFLMSIVMWKVGVRFKLHPEIRSRDVHTRPTPRLGGIAMYCGLLTALLVAAQLPYFRSVFEDHKQVIAILSAATLIVVMGVLDDFTDLDWTTKLVGQVIAAGVIAYLGGLQITNLPVGGAWGILTGSTWSSLALTLFVVIVVMNMMNFLDGLDGLVAGIAFIANLCFFLYSYMVLQLQNASYFSLATLLTISVCGMCLGFLPLNWHPARLFMGDAGSLLLGLLMAVASISVTTNIDPEVLFQTASGQFERARYAPAFMPLLLPIAVVIVPIIDFSTAVIRRIAAGKSPFSADRKHLHHRLLDMGHSRLHATLLFYSWTAVISVGSLLFFVSSQAVAWSFVGVGLLVCALATAAPLSQRKRSEVAAQSTSDVGNLSLAVHDPLESKTAREEND